MIYTITLNPAIDNTIVVEDFERGKVNRSLKSRKDIGGKGINVSKVLNELETKNICTGILGRDNSKIFLDFFRNVGIENKFYIISGENRTNIKIVEKGTGIITDINDRGFNIEKKDLDNFLNYILTLVKVDDIVVISGSLPEGIEENVYGNMTRKLKEKKVKVILDADGKPLLKGIESRPYAVKPNIHELKRIVEVDETNIHSILKGGKHLINKGIKKVLISLGSKGAIYITENVSLFSESFKVPIKSTVGAGDSMVAGLVYAMENKLNDFETLRLAVACGTAKVMTEGTKEPDLNLIRKVSKDIEIKRLS